MRTIILTILFCIIIHSCFSQNIPLSGIITVQNSKVNTGKIQYVKNAQVEHPNAKPTLSDDLGHFLLYICGLKENTQTAITLLFSGEYKDFIIVNEKDVKDITLGRIEPLKIFVCRKGDLEDRRARMVGINIKKYEERSEKEIKGLQQELDMLRQQNEYSSNRYKEIIDSLAYFGDEKSIVIEQIQKFAEVIVKENLDYKDENYLNAVSCFAQGKLDSIKEYLNDLELEQVYQSALIKKNEGKKLETAGKTIQDQADEKINHTIDCWMLLAYASVLQNNHYLAKQYFLKACSADTSNITNLMGFAAYLHYQNYLLEALEYYTKCISIYQAQDNFSVVDSWQYSLIMNYMGVIYTDIEKPDLALECFLSSIHYATYVLNEHPDEFEFASALSSVYNNLGNFYTNQHEFTLAEKYYKLALSIDLKLAEQNPLLCIDGLVKTFNNLGAISAVQGNYELSDEYLSKAIKIGETDTVSEQNFRNIELAKAYFNLGYNNSEQNNTSKAKTYFFKSLEICKSVMCTNFESFAPDYITILKGTSTFFRNINNYDFAEELSRSCLSIYDSLVKQNPLIYEPLYADILYQNGLNSKMQRDYSSSIQYYLKCAEIRERLALVDKHKYEPSFAQILNSIANSYREINEFQLSEKYYIKAKEIYERLAKNNPEEYSSGLATLYNNLGIIYISNSNYPLADSCLNMSLSIREQLAQKDPAMFDNDLAQVLNNLGVLYFNMNTFNKAIQYYTKSSEIRKRLFYENPEVYEPIYSDNLFNIGNLYFQEAKYSNAKTVLVECLGLKEHLLEIGFKVFTQSCDQTLILLIKTTDSLQEYDQSIKYTLKRLSLCEKVFSLDSIQYKNYASNFYGSLSWYQMLIGEFQNAERSAIQGLKLDSNQLWINTNLASSLLLQGRFEEAKTTYLKFAITESDDKTTSFLPIYYNDLKIFKERGLIPKSRQKDVEKLYTELNNIENATKSQ
jgi:tetratricopeptide (TPR) repeat protein